MPFYQLYYHIVWATKKRLPLITDNIENEMYKYITGKSDVMDSVVHAIGGIENHIHLIVSVPPKISLSDFVSKLKGSSSYHVNRTLLNQTRKFAWQKGFGVFSLGKKQLDQAVDYVLNQKQHHRNGSIIPVLERVEEKTTNAEE